MSEHPILFSGPMVRAILAGTKTQTRRAIKPQPDIGQAGTQCPYGAVGDRLWVRETFARNENQLSDTHMDTSIVYRADGERRALDNGGEKPWSPSIFMPRPASRITLSIDRIAVERLQEISEEDALAEGCAASPYGTWWQGYRKIEEGELLHQQKRGDAPPEWMIEPHKMRHCDYLDRSARDQYQTLWWQLNGAGSWDANPWVWVIAFKLLS